MSDAWDDKRKASEESYFAKREQEALEKAKLKGVKSSRLSPITGQPMETLSLYGVQVDRCQSSGGIWLDKGELETILKNAQEHSKSGNNSWLGDLLTDLIKR